MYAKIELRRNPLQYLIFEPKATRKKFGMGLDLYLTYHRDTHLFYCNISDLSFGDDFFWGGYRIEKSQ